MLRSEITAGMLARARVGSRIADVRVDSGAPDRTGRFACTTLDTGRAIRCTAARLRPMPGSPEDAAARARAAARAIPRPPRPFSGSIGTQTVPPAPVAGVLENVGPAPIAMLSQANTHFVAGIVGAIHVAEGFPIVARAVRSRVGSTVIWRTIPRTLRRGILHAAAAIHADNRAEYHAVMGHAPLPSEGMIARAIGAAIGLPCPR